MFRFVQLTLLMFCLASNSAFAAESLSYSGRLVNANGSPVTGPVHLKFDLAYTNNLSTILCTHDNPGVDLINGVFHAKLEFNCPSSSLKKVLEEVPTNNSIAIRVTDLTPATPKVYSFQALHSIPYTIMSNFAKQLVQMGATNGQVLTWNGAEWTPADPVGTVGGVTQVTAEEGLGSVKVDETVTIGIINGGVTAPKLHHMGATSGQVLKWNGTTWAPSTDLDTGVGSEVDPTVRAFARNDVTGIVPPSCSADQTLQYAILTDSFECADIVLNNADIQTAAVADALNDGETAKAPSQNAVFDALSGKQNTIDSSSDITMKSLKLMSDGVTWMGLKSPATAGNLFFTLPGSWGTNGQVLRTDGAGNLSWTTPSTSSADIVDGSIVDADIAAGANISQGKISGLGTSLTNLDNRITNLKTDDVPEGITNFYFTEAKVLATDLAGLNTTAGAVTATDSILSSIGKIVGNVSAVSLAQDNYVLKSGTSVMTGALNLGTNKIINLADPAADQDAATKKYVDDQTALAASQWTKTGSDIYYNSGNVGVGTVSPITKLHINGSAATASATSEDVLLLERPYNSGISFGKRASFKVGAADALSNGPGRLDIAVNASTEGIDANDPDLPTKTVMSLLGSGNVGIGTSAPSTKLTVRQTGATLRLESETENNDSSGKIVFGENTTDSNFTIRYDGAGTRPGSGVLTFNGMGAGDIMTLTRAGSVGIGTDVPANKLDVVGSVGVTGQLRLKSDNANYVELKAPLALGSTQTYTFPTSTGTSGYALTTNGAGVLSWSAVATTASTVGGDLTGTIANAQIAANAVGTSEIANSSVTYPKLNLADGDIPVLKVNGLQTALDGKEPSITASDSTKFWRGDKTWQTLNTSAVPEGTNQYFTETRVRATQLDGYLVGAADPIIFTDTLLGALGKLQGQISDSGKWSKNGTSIYYNAGNVGIGTSSPGSSAIKTFDKVLDVATTIDNSIIGYSLRNAEGVNNRRAGFFLDDANGIYGLDSTASTGIPNFVIQVAGSEKFRLNNAGNVGIGTTNPSSLLHVEINDVGSSFKISDSAAPNGYLALGEGGSTANTFTPLIVGRPVGSGKFMGVYSDIVNGEDTGTTPLMILAGRHNSGAVTTRPIFEVRNNTTPLMTILPNGNMGLGTTAPAATLDVGLRASSFPSTTTTILTRGADQNFMMAASTGVATNTNGDLVGKFGMRYINDDNAVINFYRGATFTDGSMAFSTAGVDRMRIKADGKIGVGTNTPSALLHFHTSHGGTIGGSSANIGSAALVISNLDDQKIAFDGNEIRQFGTGDLVMSGETGVTLNTGDAADASEVTALRITASGDVGIGTNSPMNKLHVIGSIGATGWVGAGCEGACSTDSYAINYANGDIKTYNGASACTKTGGAATFTCSSDERLKNNISLFTDGLDHILKLQPKTYFWNQDEKNELNYGFIAQDVQKVIPHAVTEMDRPDGKFLSLDQGAFTPYMINAIKDLNSKIEENIKTYQVMHEGILQDHERRIASLEEENEQIKSENKMMKQFLCEKYPEAEFCK